jgi:hypothetical protein
MSAWNYLFALIWIVVESREERVPRDIKELQQRIKLYGNASVYGVFRNSIRGTVQIL